MTMMSHNDLREHAVEYGWHHWPVFPLRGKLPVIPNPHPKGSREYQTCRGECGLPGHGVLDATTDVETIAAMWERYRGANIRRPCSRSDVRDSMPIRVTAVISPSPHWRSDTARSRTP